MAARVDLPIEGSPEHPTEETVPSTKERTKIPPFSAFAILKRVTDPGECLLGFDEICRRLYSGILLYDKEKKVAEQKFWVDEKLDKNCFLVLSKAMGITWSGSENNQYWEYVVEKENCFEGEVNIPVAKLKSVCWLEVKGKFKTMVLSPKTTYRVSFVVKMSSRSSGWDHPITVNLYLPDGSTQGSTENVHDKPKEEWFNVPIGSFMTNPKNVGELSFTLYGGGGNWKSGLVINGVLLQAQD
ncbi:hypothetical protein MLD38_037602 [Melastoma candidum]|uniref:Uncharacterized protein n=1 Tax=Melastoma candidum TaxID=119954 RepID=A0ACB9LN70_9MYRT|nr:hypothetical protein MLD38_037602 [Melastoma candidum]